MHDKQEWMHKMKQYKTEAMREFCVIVLVFVVSGVVYYGLIQGTI